MAAVILTLIEINERRKARKQDPDSSKSRDLEITRSRHHDITESRDPEDCGEQESCSDCGLAELCEKKPTPAP